ncbi:MAG TPA: lyase family protein [Thermoanaerobaculia bacterium]|nr:lyase family protein [Thermoanaerobaculia bacterium]
MSRLWDKGEALSPVVARFTVGRDPQLDGALVAWDALASAAHAVMLRRLGVLSAGELAGLLAELAAAAHDARAGRFPIAAEDEDGHTALENRLTAALGEAGRKIHTGRSRNDQVIAALRLWGRAAVLDLADAVLAVAGRLANLAEEHRETSLPGYTHTRQAMPSTLGFLFAAHAEGLADALPWLDTAFAHLDRCPLGSASGYGVALPLDRRLVAELLAFGELQVNTLAVQNDRGRTEMLVLGAALAPAGDLSRLAADLIWLSSDEIRGVRLAPAVTTGSSIMPQKRNPDVLELVRAGAARLRARHAEAAAVYQPLASGYHRDLQLTKAPFVEGLADARDLVLATAAALDGTSVDVERCRALTGRAIGATDEVYRRVAEGVPFRDAYREVGADPQGAVQGDPTELWRRRTHEGAPGALDIAAIRRRLERAGEAVAERRRRIDGAWELLAAGAAAALERRAGGGETGEATEGRRR